MAFPAPEHEIHRRRFSRNLGVGLTLVCFVALVFALTVVKVTNGDLGHANDAPGMLGSTVPIAPELPAPAPATGAVSP
ncbi:hypothetical protein [Cypionkella sp.]|jgi:hypothetical protein|uniref:hypothetical protein n=1 Tax=Cypionkella sp. TaxID=2811411 RepID=UPI00271C5F93|nr:hypothetical protein [Cypionkella sp.]MDO8982961.1 hypothetical protein [Cypionkella sp.]MDP1575762.1 hypothetical protein [Cypionkella sp.]MDP2047644.1 hypothetical protein [Cypionkella sp.]